MLFNEDILKDIVYHTRGKILDIDKKIYDIVGIFLC